jgi:glycosyltransferase involved in cell wall biosynthesis
MIRPKAIFVTASDAFFLSHRLSLARALRLAGFDVLVAAAPTGAGPEIESEGMRFIALPLNRRSMSPWCEARTLAAIVALYYCERPALVHHSSIKAILYGSYAARLLRLPAFVNTVSGLGYALTERPTDGVPQRILRIIARIAYRLALRGRSCWNIFQNPHQFDHFVKLGLANPAQSSLVRGAGVDTGRFQPSPLPDGEPVVLLPARLLWDKGIGEFVDAARGLHRSGVRARFVLVGKEDYESRAAIPRHNVDAWVAEGTVEWWGHRIDMPAVLARAHVVVLPSYAEGLPLALAEAAAAGRACITTDVAGCREAVIDKVTGWLIPAHNTSALADSIRYALAHPAELAAAGLRGREHAVATLSQERVLRETFEVFRRLRVQNLSVNTNV